MTGARLDTADHGGDLDAARRRFPRAPEPWLDLSTGINPTPYPLPDVPPEVWYRLPLASELSALCETAARRYGALDSATVVAAPGTQALIQVVPRLFPRSQVAVLSPTYAEHARSWQLEGHDVAEVSRLAEAQDAAVIVIVNPDNPTGRYLTPDQLATIAQECSRRSAHLIVDEAFADTLAVDATLVPRLPPATIVLRSVGKMYGLAGLRLGFAIAEPPLAERLRDLLGPWPVSGPALAIGRAVLADDQWLAAARTRVAGHAHRLQSLLTGHGFLLLGGTSLFQLTSHRFAAAMADHLGGQGICVRQFRDRPDWLRFGLPGDEPAWSRLGRALAAFQR